MPRRTIAAQASLLAAIVTLEGGISLAHSSPALLEANCSKCHNEEKAKGKFKLSDLGTVPTNENFKLWVEALDLVSAEEMPPEEDSELSKVDRQDLVAWIEGKVRAFGDASTTFEAAKPRRLNNREFANSVRDALLLDDIGTHLPVDNLIGDALHNGFDTNGDRLGFSRFHLEQFLAAARKIVDAVILNEVQRPEPKRYLISPDRIASLRLNQNAKRPVRHGTTTHFEFLDPKQPAYFPEFQTVPTTGRYRIKIRATGKDRLVYDTVETGFYHGDPIKLEVRMGDRVRSFDLPDEEVTELQLDEWLAAGSRLELGYPTDAFALRGNGNFKFQYAIGGEHIKETDPDEYARRAAAIKRGESKRNRRRAVTSWHHWVDDWRGARPQILGVVIEGPIYETWPPKRQVALIGEDPSVDNAATILTPIAERAWRRPVRDGELDEIVTLVRDKADSLGDIAALKEGIVAIFVSPAFLLLNPEGTEPADRFATKLASFLHSTIPSAELRAAARSGQLDNFEAVRNEIARQFASGEAEPFLRQFPYAWLKLNDINFMAPDPDHYRFYHRKRISEDMVDEVLHFFRHMIDNNRPVTEFISADYSFINADLAQVYGIEGALQDSKFRKHTFTDGRRGGLLGMGAFLTLTADSLSTSPIHRAVYVMENFLGIHPTPPPPNVEIKEPDVRQAKTIKEVLAAHTADSNCASCHQSIDPYGYAFENFDPTGAWRDRYTIRAVADKQPKSTRVRHLPIDPSAKFRNGFEYRDIVGFREGLLSDANRKRFIRCFIAKLLNYANGTEPENYVEIEKIVSKSAENDYRIIDTIAAMIDSPLFRTR